MCNLYSPPAVYNGYEGILGKLCNIELPGESHVMFTANVRGIFLVPLLIPIVTNVRGVAFCHSDGINNWAQFTPHTKFRLLLKGN